VLQPVKATVPARNRVVIINTNVFLSMINLLYI
jgi:hypothetical protein